MAETYSCSNCPIMDMIEDDQDVGDSCEGCFGETVLDPECKDCDEGDCSSCGIAIQKAEQAIGA